jgi:hypothetical protein
LQQEIETETVTWMSYAELGRARGTSAASAKRYANRQRWRKQPGNDGTVRVAVPPGGTVPRETVRGRVPGDGPDLSRLLDGANTRADEANRRADAAIALAEGALAQTADANARADRAEGRVTALQAGLEVARAEAQAARKAEQERRARGRWARLRAAWRGERG